MSYISDDELEGMNRVRFILESKKQRKYKMKRPTMKDRRKAHMEYIRKCAYDLLEKEKELSG